MALGAQFRLAGSGDVGFWMVATFWCLFAGFSSVSLLAIVRFVVVSPQSNQSLQPTPSRRDSFLFHDYNTSTDNQSRSR
jgi:hypothetical protein